MKYRKSYLIIFLISIITNIALGIALIVSYNISNKDALTNAYNRRYFESYYQQVLNDHQKFSNNLSILMIDIDFFKKINDNYGHISGDEVLIEFSNRVQTAIRSTDILARYGGEEFAVILPNANLQNAKYIAERIHTMINDQKFIISNYPFYIKVTCSIGIAQIRPDDDRETLLKRADEALYKAKENGRNQIYFLKDI